jgi:subtilisin
MTITGHTRALALLLVLVAAGALGDWPVHAQSRRPSGQRIPSAVTAQATAHGSVRVLVGLNVAFAPESSLGVSGVQSQRASITRAQNAVLGRVMRAKSTSIRRFNYIPFMALEVDEADLQALAASQDVTDIQIDAVAPPLLATSTPLIGATKAWAAGYTGAGWTVALLDTGVDGTHPFLAGKVVSEACYSSTVADRSSTMCPSGGDVSTLPGSGGPCLLPGCEHGTHVAGIAAGKGSAFSGVAPDATIISVQVFSSFSSDDCGDAPRPCLLSYTSDQILGLERVYALRSSYNIAAVNMSLGTSEVYTEPCDVNSLKTMIDELRTAGIATVIASGNGGSITGLSSPACISTAISVGSTTDGISRPPDEVSVFSNTNQYLSLLAPGTAINSSMPGGWFTYKSGTSMAAPHVAGAWALMKSKRPSASVTEILNALVATGTPITDPGNGLVLPRINVDAALSTIHACDYAVTPSQISVGPQAGTVTIGITTSAQCAWSATTASPFVAVTSNQPSGVGSGSIVLSYSANQSHWARDGDAIIAGTRVTISQRTVRAVAGDLSGDGRADILWQNMANGSLATWWLDGWNVVGTFEIGNSQGRDPNWRVVGTGDLNGDGNTDLVWRHETEGWLAVWYLSGCQVLDTQYLSINRVADTDWRIRGVGDVDGDGKADLIWQHATQGLVAVWLMNGTQVVSTRMLSIDRVPDLQWQIAGAGDADGDGKADLIWQHQSNGWLAAWFMNGSDVVGTRLLSIDQITDTNWHIRGVGDVDGNGRADLLWQNDATSALGVWLLNGSTVVGQRSLSIDHVGDVNWRVVGPG